MSIRIPRIKPTVWSQLRAEAEQEPPGIRLPLTLVPWNGNEIRHPGTQDLADWECIARYCANPVAEQPYAMAIGLIGEKVVGYVETTVPGPAACKSGLDLLRGAGANRIITACLPSPGGELHVRSLLASLWWERAALQAGLPVEHTWTGDGLSHPVPFSWPTVNPERQPLTIALNPDLTPDQVEEARRLTFDPGAPLRYVALLGEIPVGVANVYLGPLGSYGEDAAAVWSPESEDRVCLVRWISSLLMGWGIGSQIYARIEADAVAAGARAVVLEARPFTRSDLFWERQGFRLVPRDQRTPYRYMEKVLTPAVQKQTSPLSA